MALNLKTSKVSAQSTSVEKEKKYPWIGYWGEYVVLFVAPCKGVCLHDTDRVLVNQGFDGSFTENMYKPFYGTLTMTFEQGEE